jgi:tripartite ATP-independent transporter DctM subunit
MDPVIVGFIGIVVLFFLFAMNLPVSFSMALVGLAGFAFIVNWNAAAGLISRDFFDTFSSYPLSVIVLFVLMGSFAFASGMSSRIYNSANTLAGKMPGGMAIATVLACSAFAAICGSSAATAATIGKVALPEMKRFGYSDKISTGCIAATGSIGILIPPSTIFIVYSILTQQSVGDLFAAGIMPGILLTVFFLVVILIMSRLSSDFPKGVKTTFRQKIIALIRVFDIVFLFLLSIGGLFLGWYSPSQAAGIGAAGTLLIGLIHRKLTWQAFFSATKDGLRTSCMILFLIAGATIFGKFMTVTTIPSVISVWVSGLSWPPFWIMVVIAVMFFVAGCFIDAMALIMITIPIIYPLVLDLGYDPVWFGVLIVLISQIAVVTPPVGVNVYVTKGIAPHVPIENIFQGTFPFLLALIFLLALVIMFPDLVLILPEVLNG